MINLRLPKIDAPTTQEQIKQMQSYIIQLVNELQVELVRLETDNKALKEEIQRLNR